MQFVHTAHLFCAATDRVVIGADVAHNTLGVNDERGATFASHTHAITNHASSKTREPCAPAPRSTPTLLPQVVTVLLDQDAVVFANLVRQVGQHRNLHGSESTCTRTRHHTNTITQTPSQRGCARIRAENTAECVDSARMSSQTLLARSVDPGEVGEVAVHGAARNLAVDGVELWCRIVEGADLSGADEREVQWVEEQHQVLALHARQAMSMQHTRMLLAHTTTTHLEVRQLDLLEGKVHDSGGFEIGGGLADERLALGHLVILHSRGETGSAPAQQQQRKRKFTCCEGKCGQSAASSNKRVRVVGALC